MIPSHAYSFSQVSIFLGGRDIVGFTEDGITITPMTDFAESVVGADGAVVIATSQDNRHEVLMNMMEGSSGYKDIGELFELQNIQNPIQKLSFIMDDYISGDKISTDEAFILGRPALTKAKGVTARIWKLILPNPLIKYGSKILG